MADEQAAPLHEWQQVNSKDSIQLTFRMHVPGGWLYRYTSPEGTCVAFVPDANAGKGPRRPATVRSLPFR